jgi:hypothetical protein
VRWPVVAAPAIVACALLRPSPPPALEAVEPVPCATHREAVVLELQAELEACKSPPPEVLVETRTRTRTVTRTVQAPPVEVPGPPKRCADELPQLQPVRVQETKGGGRFIDDDNYRQLGINQAALEKWARDVRACERGSK